MSSFPEPESTPVQFGDASPPVPAPPPPVDPPWTGVDVFIIFLVAIFTILAVSGVAMQIAIQMPAFEGAALEEIAADPLITIPAQSLAYLIIFFAIYAIVARRTAAGFWEALRWRWPALPTVVSYLLLGTVLSVAVQVGSRYLPIPSDMPIQRMFRDPTAAWLLLAFGTLLAPLMEELFFRGLLYPVLARRWGAAAAIALTAATFAFIHGPQLASAWAPLLLLFTVGVAITAVRAYTGSVAASFIVHVAYNGLIFLLIFVKTEGFRHLERLHGNWVIS